MRRAVVAACLVLSLGAGPARAGLYHPAEPLPPVTNYRVFQATLSDLRGLVGELTPQEKEKGAEKKLQAEYRKRLGELEDKHKQGALTPEDRVNLSAYYLRLFEPGRNGYAERAIEVSTEVAPGQRDFMTWSNLATAYQLSGTDPLLAKSRLESARAALQEALQVWPAEHPRFTAWELLWYRRVEKYHLDLLTLRLRDAERTPPDTERERQKDFFRKESVDDLFPALRAAWQRGGYAAGPLRPELAERLPGDASLIVRQLVLWLPGDNRLYWLLGELANAREGDFRTAFAVLNELVGGRNYSLPEELGAHRRALFRATTLAEPVLTEPDEAIRKQLAEPSGSGLAALAWAALGQQIKPEWSKPPASSGLAPPEKANQPRKEQTADASKWLPDWKPLGIGFASGVVVALLVGFQVREFRRRRQAGTKVGDRAA